jgi:tetratricopeptide (TPR) repeat protein
MAAQVTRAVPAQQSDIPAPEGLTVVIKSQHRRLTFTQDIQRIAVGDTEILSAEVISGRELLLAPDHAALRETHAAALYFDGKFADARAELAMAGALGAPRWRIAYHLGLVEEASGRGQEASRYYAEAVGANPGFAPAESRLKALRAGDSTRP